VVFLQIVFVVARLRKKIEEVLLSCYCTVTSSITLIPSSTLEVFPIIVGLMALTLLVGRCGVTKLIALVDQRQDGDST